MEFGISSRRLLRAAIPVLLLLAVTAGTAMAENVVYNKYNIHVQEQTDRRGNRQLAASYANYTDPGSGHRIIPPGTPLVVKKANRKEIVFLNQKDNTQINFEYHEPRMGMKAEEYIGRITSVEPVSLKHLSKTDRKGAEEGKAYEGMTREGVLAALGYPAAHRTSSLEADTWVYWTNRFKTIAVEFNDQGKVVNVRR